MENNKFNLRIIDFYKNIDIPIINNMVSDNSFKNILELSSISEISLLKKQKKKWCLIDKRKILKDIEITKKKKINEIKNNLSKIDIIKIDDIKNNNNKLLSDLESINLLKNNIINDDIYNNIKNISLLSNVVELIKEHTQDKQNKKNNQLGGLNSSIKIIDFEENINTKQKLETIKLNLEKTVIISDSDDFIEIFSN
jgi:hypothetical protein